MTNDIYLDIFYLCSEDGGGGGGEERGCEGRKGMRGKGKHNVKD
jgi:hypothetical protein